MDITKLLDAPVPGQSLTTPVGGNGLPGNSPFEKPPQFANPNDALEYMWNKITDPKKAMNLILMLRKKIPVQYIAQTALFEGAAQGVFSFDVAQLIAPTVVRMIAAVGHLAGVKDIRIKNPDTKQDEFLSQFTDLLNDKPKTPAKPDVFTGLSNG